MYKGPFAHVPDHSYYENNGHGHDKTCLPSYEPHEAYVGAGA